MAFVRKKTVNGREYYYLVSTERRGGKVHQKTLAQLGQYKSLEAAINGMEAELNRLIPVLDEFFQNLAEFSQRSRALDAWLNATVHAPNQDEVDISSEEHCALGKELGEVHRKRQELKRVGRERLRQCRRAQKLQLKLQRLRSLKPP